MRSFLLLLALFSSAHGFRFSRSTCLVKGDMSCRGLSTIQMVDDADELLYKPVSSQGERGMKGFYRRPSKAIEQGGGFFIPGLEGERIRIVTALALLVALLVNQMGQTFSTFNEVVSESVGVITIILLFIQGISAGLGQEDVIEVSQTFMSIVQSSDDGAARRAEIISKSIIQSCEDINYILVLSSKPEEAKLILEYASIGAASITKTCGLKELQENFQTESVNSKPQAVGNVLSESLPVSSRYNGQSENIVYKMSDSCGNTWVVSMSKNTGEGAVQDEKIMASAIKWISKLVQVPM